MMMMMMQCVAACALTLQIHRRSSRVAMGSERRASARGALMLLFVVQSHEESVWCHVRGIGDGVTDDVLSWACW
eukprot:1519128-Rhodomonas_salina.1